MLVFALGAPSHCLWPPEYELAPDINLPVTLDPALLPVLEGWYSWTGCPGVFSLDIANAIKDPDGDPLYIAWVVNYEAGLDQRLDDTNTPEFTFDPCSNPRVVLGNPPNRINVWVVDRPPPPSNSADDFRTGLPADATLAEATWYLLVEDDTCCTTQP